ncbi:hypothetical protein Bca52824_044403 [Brassica carinata]|uniref:Lipase n=1 Tax=Brassica carinata TaxID=52824 RepID=A0A8X7V0M3_BRACI|nr:hypothetical protein Bca52824_044403 [Brassica carinata]
MDKKHGLFSKSHSRRSRSKSPVRAVSPIIIRRRKGRYVSHPDRHVSEMLPPVIEGPDPDGEDSGSSGDYSRLERRWYNWMKCQLPVAPPSVSSSSSGFKRTDLRLLLGVLGAPLGPVHVSALDLLPHLSIKNTPMETSSAQYILQQYTAASGGQKLHSSVHNGYVMGRIRTVASEFETGSKGSKSKNNSSKAVESGGFVLWHMSPDMWYMELVLGGSKVLAGCDGKLVWRHTPWLGPHAAKGPVRPLRRALQGLDPRTTANMFASARCIGEKKIDGEDCFILKLCADPATLRARSEGASETIRHTLFGYFSQKTGLLVHLEDSQLTRIQNIGGEAVYWETTINSYLEDYKPVEGIVIAHSGRSVATLLRFGDMSSGHNTKTTMQEAWVIDEIAFNVPGLSMDCFIPPSELRFDSQVEDLSQGPKIKTLQQGSLSLVVVKKIMVLSDFTGVGVGFGTPLNLLGVGVGGGCGVGLGLGWGFGTAFGSHYRSSRLTFQGIELEKEAKVENMSKNT